MDDLAQRNLSISLELKFRIRHAVAEVSELQILERDMHNPAIGRDIAHAFDCLNHRVRNLGGGAWPKVDFVSRDMCTHGLGIKRAVHCVIAWQWR